MTARKSSDLVPKLRFPAFRKAVEWETKPISKLAQIVKGVQLNKSKINEGEFPVWNGGVTPSGFHDEWNTEGETITISEGGNSCGFVNLSNQRFWLGGHCYALKNLSSENDGTFLFQLLKSNETEIMRLRVGSGLPNIQRHALERFPIVFPHPAEQKKIADCLGSLDDLIAAQARKLEALRQHKQGLMQQLFPRPGETVPRLRFPAFRDGPGWSSPQLAELYRFKRTNTLSRDKLSYETGAIRNIHYGDIHTRFRPLFCVREERVPYVNPNVPENEFGEDEFCEEGDIVLADVSEDIDDVGKAIEVVSLDGESVVSGTHTIFATRRGRIPVIGFGGQLFQSSAVRAGIKKEAQGSKVHGISANRISSVEVPFPPTESEQRKIADCLGSLDDLIAAQARKLEALRQHKQGLMQQLFPSSREGHA